MGLDTLAALSPKGEKLPLAIEDDFKLHCGSSYLRGKKYHKLVWQITGVSLYEDWIEPVTVDDMYQAIIQRKAELEKTPTLPEYCQLGVVERFLKLCSRHHLGLVAR